MSHDRGCWCGRERYEYDKCPDSKCFKKKRCDVVFDFHSPHNNEYWYRCNTCGATDWVSYYDRDKLKPLKDCKMSIDRSMNYVKLYLWVKKGHNPKIIEDVLSLYKNPDFDAEQDQIFEIGPEVKLELNVKVIPKKPVTRNSSGGYLETFENR